VTCFEILDIKSGKDIAGNRNKTWAKIYPIMGSDAFKNG
jgi:hypothetical protein